MGSFLSAIQSKKVDRCLNRIQTTQVSQAAPMHGQWFPDLTKDEIYA